MKPNPQPRHRTQVLACPVDKVTLAEAAARCLAFAADRSPHLVVTPNAEIAYMAVQDQELQMILEQADLVVADGSGIVMAARLLGDPVPEKVAGVDLAAAILAGAPPETRVFLLGATKVSVEKAACYLVDRYPHIVVAGYRDGYWDALDPAANAEVIRSVQQAAPHILFAGLGAPKQEKWLHRHRLELGVPLAIGIGGGIDLWAGISPRAPEWLRHLHMEWLYRIVKFRRFGRSLPPLAKFTLRVLARRLQGRQP